MPPQELASRFDRLDAVLEGWTIHGNVPAIAYAIGDSHGEIIARQFGRQSRDRDQPLREDALFLVASLTKPLTVMAVMMLVERGLITLDDRVRSFVPEFLKHGKGEVTLRHLMTHTSGLPDMLPQNDRLRAGHQPLSTFVAATNDGELLFEPGTEVRYQSMGTLMLGEIVRQVDGRDLARFLHDEVFLPLGMANSWLGAPVEVHHRIAEIALMPALAATDWHWNSPYWRSLGAPWGGLVTTTTDFAQICRLFLAGGAVQGTRIISRATVRQMTSHALVAFPKLAREELRCRPWGLGWRHVWPGSSSHFGNLLSPRAYGHWGATGTLCWIDPACDAFAVIFSTKPAGSEGRHLALASNLIAAGLNSAIGEDFMKSHANV